VHWEGDRERLGRTKFTQLLGLAALPQQQANGLAWTFDLK